jgi:hypothetical protein
MHKCTQQESEPGRSWYVAQVGELVLLGYYVGILLDEAAEKGALGAAATCSLNFSFLNAQLFVRKETEELRRFLSALNMCTPLCLSLSLSLCVRAYICEKDTPR